MSAQDQVAAAQRLLARLPIGDAIRELRRETGLSGREARRVITEARAAGPEVSTRRTKTWPTEIG